MCGYAVAIGRPRAYVEVMTVLLVASKGGHLDQARRFADHLEQGAVIQYLTDVPSEASEGMFVLPRVVDYEEKTGVLKRLFRAVVVLFRSLAIMRKTKPILIVTFGGAFCVPVAVAAKMLGIELLHIESWSRIRSVSRSTEHVLRLNLAKAIGYQYPESVLNGRPNCRYIGHL